MSHEYPLEVLIELRSASVDAAERSLAEEVGRLDELTEQLEALKTQKSDLTERRREYEQRFHRRRREGTVGASDYATMRRYLEGIDLDIAQTGREMDRTEVRVEAQQESVDAHRRELADAKAELEVVDRHRSSWRDEKARLAARRRREEMNEIGMTIWRGTRYDSAY